MIAYASLEKTSEKQTKMIEDQGQKQIKAIENRVEKHFLDLYQKSIVVLYSENFLNEKATYKINKTAEIEKKVGKNDLVYKAHDNVKG